MSIVKKRVRQSRSLLVAALALVVVSCSGGSNTGTGIGGTGTGGTPTPINPNSDPIVIRPPAPQYVSHRIYRQGGDGWLVLAVTYDRNLAPPPTPSERVGAHPYTRNTVKPSVSGASEFWPFRNHYLTVNRSATFHYIYPSPGTQVIFTLTPSHVYSGDNQVFTPFAETVVLPAYTAI